MSCAVHAQIDKLQHNDKLNSAVEECLLAGDRVVERRSPEGGLGEGDQAAESTHVPWPCGSSHAEPERCHGGGECYKDVFMIVTNLFMCNVLIPYFYGER